MNIRASYGPMAAALLLFASCVIGDESELELEDDILVDDLNEAEEAEDFIDPNAAITVYGAFVGINGKYCKASPFNCRFRQGSSRVLTASGEESWGIATGASVRDGNGKAMFTQTKDRMTFNYGQTRFLAGKAHALALSTSNGSAGWYPIDHILGETSFRARMGEVNAKNPGLGKLGCYQVRNSHSATMELKKVVFDSKVGETGHERAGDYLPLLRNNGERSVNLIFMVPGFALGGATTDHFRAGTKFQRVVVPTSTGKPSITIPLWVKDEVGRYRKRSGSMRFLYGYVRASDGVKRFGWMAEAALLPSDGCS